MTGGSGLHPIIRSGIASGVRALAPHLISLLANKIAGTGRRRTYRKRGGAIVHRPIIRYGVGAKKKRTVRRVRPIVGSAWQLSSTRGSGYRKRKIGCGTRRVHTTRRIRI